MDYKNFWKDLGSPYDMRVIPRNAASKDYPGLWAGYAY